MESQRVKQTTEILAKIRKLILKEERIAVEYDLIPMVDLERTYSSSLSQETAEREESDLKPAERDGCLVIRKVIVAIDLS
jgi:hypothetical protein